jgi:hypothetical protein
MTKSATREKADEVSAPIASPVFTGNVSHGDNVKAKFGTGNDLEIFHDGSHSRIKDVGTGHLVLSGGEVHFNDSSNTSNHLAINAAGIVTKPLQPAFSANAVETNNVPVNTWQTINLTEIFDNNADFNPSTDVFTAPVGGKYQLNGSIRVDNLPQACGYMYIRIITSNRGYFSIVSPPAFDSTPQYWGLVISHLADMDAGDTATLGFYIGGGTVGADIHSESIFSGFLAC